MTYCLAEEIADNLIPLKHSFQTVDREFIQSTGRKSIVCCKYDSKERGDCSIITDGLWEISVPNINNREAIVGMIAHGLAHVWYNHSMNHRGIDRQIQADRWAYNHLGDKANYIKAFFDYLAEIQTRKVEREQLALDIIKSRQSELKDESTNTDI
jgi:hypothetical protein